LMEGEITSNKEISVCKDIQRITRVMMWNSKPFHLNAVMVLVGYYRQKPFFSMCLLVGSCSIQASTLSKTINNETWFRNDEERLW
jgi:hypothetical protein